MFHENSIKRQNENKGQNNITNCGVYLYLWKCH